MSDPSKNEIGRIVGEATTLNFFFTSDEEEYPQRWEYLTVPSQEVINGERKKVKVLAQVQKIIAKSQALRKNLSLEDVKKIKQAGVERVNVWGNARILGYMHEGHVRTPKRAIQPGKPVYIAPKDILQRFFSYSPDEGLHVGNLITRPDVPVNISIKGFRRHLAILAQTGAGKSYLAGVLLEELLKKGATTLVLDPHADYVFLGQTKHNEKYKYHDRILVFRNPESTGRYTRAEIGNIRDYKIKFADLSPWDIFSITGIQRGFANIREAVKKAVESLEGNYMPGDLVQRLNALRKSEKASKNIQKGAGRARKYIKRLTRSPVFGKFTVPLTDMLRPQSTSVLDLSGLGDQSMDLIVQRLLSEAYELKKSGEYPYPVFIFLEEAHKFIPRDDRTHSKQIINKIASEGRKFGVFQILISQRPFKIDSDSLSQCNSQLILRTTNPEDQNAIRIASERMSEELLEDLPGLDTGEAVCVGEMTKVPVMLQVRKRKTQEGGGDINIVKQLKKARKAHQREEKEVQEQEDELDELTGDF